jgi:hypothetical protein
MQLRQKQPACIHVAAGNVRVDVDAPRHDDFAGYLIGLVGGLSSRRRNDAIISNEEIAGARLAVRRIDNAPAAQARQHQAASRAREAAISSNTASALGRSLGWRAPRQARDCVSRANATPS